MMDSMRQAEGYNSQPRPVSAEAMTRLRTLALAMIGFLLFSQIGLHPFSSGQVNVGGYEGDIDKQVIMLGLALIVLVTSWDRRELRNNLSLSMPILIVLGYCAASMIWALEPVVTLRRLALTLLATWFMYRQTQMLGRERMLYVLRCGLALLLLFNFLAVMFFNQGVHEFALGDDPSIVGNWKGLLAHKNNAGAACALTIIMFLFDWRPVGRSRSLAVVIAAAIFLYFTHSKTSAFSLAAGLAAGWGISHLGRHGASTRAFLLVLGAAVGIEAYLFYQQDLLDTLSDPHGFTGRSTIWYLLLIYARDHMWTGAGYGSFWQIGNKSPIWDLDNSWVAQYASSGHNGYIDLLVTIGLPGLLLTVGLLLVMPAYRLWTSTDMAMQKRGLYGSIIAFTAIHNLSESSLLERTSPIYLMLIFTLAALDEGRMSRQPLLARLRRWRGRVWNPPR